MEHQGDFNSAHLATYQQAAICDQKAKINERMQYESAKREGHDETLHVLIEMSLFARQI